MYVHKSGSQKRKERKELEQSKKREHKKQTTLNFNLQSTQNNDKPPDTSSMPANPSSEAPIVENSNLSGMIESDVIKNTPDTENKVIQSLPKSENQSIWIEQPNDFDIGTLKGKILNPQLIEDAVRHGHEKMPMNFPRDELNEPFPKSLLCKILPNTEKVERNWLVWSRILEAFFCLPCRLFCSNTAASRSHLCHPEGYTKIRTWKKLYDRLPAHENNQDHIQSYVKWRNLENTLKKNSSVGVLLSKQIENETKKWREILKRILDTILFLGERGLALRGDSNLIGAPNNGNFLGVLELIAHYDPVLRNHLQTVKDSQQSHHRLQAHYLSSDIQNEFIELCAQHVRKEILNEPENSKYYALIVDATPDSSHVEQTTFILRYLHYIEETMTYAVKERFLILLIVTKKLEKISRT